MDLSGSITILTTLPLVYLRLTPILCKICAGNNHLLWGKDTTKLPLIKVAKTKVQLNLGAQSKKLIKTLFYDCITHKTDVLETARQDRAY